ncbi:MAG: hypothetical protein K2K97_04145 [Muribaculaceae bacterium]|nr:hypothetical protein [Muribaculaceae bacterium]
MSEPLNIKKEFMKAQKWTSDTLSGVMSHARNEVEAPSVSRINVSYAEVVRELLSQIDNGCDIIPIDSSFSYEDLMEWIISHARGNKVLIINDTLEHSTGQVIAVVYAQDNKVLLSKDMPKVCFIYQMLNPSIQDLFPEGVKVYVKPFKFV